MISDMNRVIALTLIGFVVGATLAGCISLTPYSDDIVVVKERHESYLMSLPSVVGVGIGDCDGKPCIKVYVEESTSELQRQIPKQLEGFEVEIEVTGAFEAQPQ